jgi:hypothetical protein
MILMVNLERFGSTYNSYSSDAVSQVTFPKVTGGSKSCIEKHSPPFSLKIVSSKPIPNAPCPKTTTPNLGLLF